MSNTQKMIDRVVEYRQLPPIKKGMSCEVDGKVGTVVGGNSAANLNVLFEGESKPMNCHPEFRMKIFNNEGEVIHASKYLGECGIPEFVPENQTKNSGNG